MDPLVFWSPGAPSLPPVTGDLIAQAQHELGVALPREYVSLLRHKNGGATAGFGIPTATPTTWAEDHVPLDDMFGIAGERLPVGASSILDSGYFTLEWGLPPHQVVLSGEGHWWITLDYRNRSIPCVTWLNVEAGQDMTIAASFADLLSVLRPLHDFEAED